MAIGLERTGRIVTAAALLFAIAIGAFATSKMIFIKQNGVGTALAVLIDASIIRALLVPSLMALLGQVELVGARARCGACTRGSGSARQPWRRRSPSPSASNEPRLSRRRPVRRGGAGRR